MNTSILFVFALVYALIAVAALTTPAVAGFYVFCFGATIIKALRQQPSKSVRRSPLGYAR